jgi:hypothetical protein
LDELDGLVVEEEEADADNEAELAWNLLDAAAANLTDRVDELLDLVCAPIDLVGVYIPDLVVAREQTSTFATRLGRHPCIMPLLTATKLWSRNCCRWVMLRKLQYLYWSYRYALPLTPLR